MDHCQQRTKASFIEGDNGKNTELGGNSCMYAVSSVDAAYRAVPRSTSNGVAKRLQFPGRCWVWTMALVWPANGAMVEDAHENDESEGWL